MPINYGGLVELVVNAIVDVPAGFLEWEFRLEDSGRYRRRISSRRIGMASICR